MGETVVVPVTGPERKWWEKQGCLPLRVCVDFDAMVVCVRGRDYRVLRDPSHADRYVVVTMNKSRVIPAGFFSATRVNQTVSIEVCRDLKAIRAAVLGLPYQFVVAHAVEGGYVHPDACATKVGRDALDRLYTAKNLEARCLVCAEAFE